MPRFEAWTNLFGFSFYHKSPQFLYNILNNKCTKTNTEECSGSTQGQQFHLSSEESTKKVKETNSLL